MADNYLEKKMDDLRSGRLIPAAARGRGESRKGVWTMDFPCRRVLVAEGCDEVGKAVIVEFCRIGCKVAFMSSDINAGTALARESGARFIQCDLTDSMRVADAVAVLVKAWRDVDIVIDTTGVSSERILTALALHRAALPYPNDFGGRVVVITGDDVAETRSDEVTTLASRYGMTFNRIVLKDDGAKRRYVATLCVFLSSVAGGVVDGATIAVNADKER